MHLSYLYKSTKFNLRHETDAHELGHEVENVKGFGELKKAALEATKQEERDEWAKMYREKFPDMSPEDIKTEVAMKALGRRLATPLFIKRYANRSTLLNLIDHGRAFLKAMREGEAAMLELAETEKLINMMNEALIKGEVSQNEAKGESGTKRYLFIGAKADTADKMRLSMAQDMIASGADPEQVRKDTGWFQGYDGKWRFEIDDSDISIDNRKLQKHESEYTLDEVVSHKALFEAYPELAKTKVVVQYGGLVKGAVGAYIADKDILIINSAIWLKDEDMKKVLVHEMQHKVQRIEGFARGSSPEYWAKRGISEAEYNDFVAKTEMELAKAKRGLSDSDKEKLNEYYVLGKQQDKLYSKLDFKNIFDEEKNAEMQKIIDQIAPIEKRHDELYDYLYYQPWFARINELYYQTEVGEKLNTVFYKNTAGEIEARNAAERINLTVEERKNTQPDVNRLDVVFAENSQVAKDFVGWTADNNEVYVTTAKTMSMSDADRKQKFFNDYANNFRGRRAKFKRNGHTYYAKFEDTKNGLGKLVYEGNAKSSQSSSPGYKAKIRMLADGNLFELVEDAVYDDTQPETGKTNKFHLDAKHWDYYVKTIIVDGKAYDVMVNVRIDVINNNYSTKQEYVYSIRFRDNKKVATSLVHHATSKATSQFDAATINDSVPQSKKFVNDFKEKNKISYNLSDKKIDNVTSEDLQKLKKHFGTTNNFDVAGYLLTDGKMLDFSGKHWGDDYSTSRTVDHRDVLEGFNYEGVHNGNNGVKAMVDMIGSGNIRLAPESGGINIAVAPNDTQIWKLTEYIRHFRGEVVVDIDAVGGDTIHTFTYNKGTAPMAVIRDIMQYFEDGTVPQPQPDYRQFRYNLAEDAADQAARDAAEAADQREQELRKREQKASKAEREAEISRIETRARDYNAYYYKYEDIKSLIDTINKDAKLGFADTSDAAFEAYSQLNAFRAEVYKADYRQSFLETTTEYLIEAADAQAGRELRLGDIDRRYSQCSPLHPLLN